MREEQREKHKFSQNHRKETNLHLALIVGSLQRLVNTQETQCKKNIKILNSDNEKLARSDEQNAFFPYLT